MSNNDNTNELPGLDKLEDWLEFTPVVSNAFKRDPKLLAEEISAAVGYEVTEEQIIEIQRRLGFHD